MKKTSKLLGAIALSATLAIGCAMPAFAETSQPTDTVSDAVSSDTTEVNAADPDAARTADTTVNVSTYVSQISVKVPLTLSVMTDVAGGFGKSPSANAYYIENGGTLPVKITNAQTAIVDAATADWGFVAENAATPAAVPLSGKNIGGISIKLTPTTTKTGTTANKNISGGYGLDFVSAVSGVDMSSRTGWTIPAGTGAASNGSTKLQFTVQTKSTKLKAEQESGEVAKITYTVAAGSNEGTGSEEPPSGE